MCFVDVKESFLENDFCQMWLSNGIMILEYKPKLVINLHVAKQILSDRLKLANGVTRPLLLDARNFISMDRASMKFYKTKETIQYINASAFISGSALGSLAGNIFLTMERPLVPTKLFTNGKNALEWLEKFKFMN